MAHQQYHGYGQPGYGGQQQSYHQQAPPGAYGQPQQPRVSIFQLSSELITLCTDLSGSNI